MPWSFGGVIPRWRDYSMALSFGGQLMPLHSRPGAILAQMSELTVALVVQPCGLITATPSSRVFSTPNDVDFSTTWQDKRQSLSCSCSQAYLLSFPRCKLHSQCPRMHCGSSIPMKIGYMWYRRRRDGTKEYNSGLDTYSQKRYREAEQLFRQPLQQREKVLGRWWRC